MAFESLPSLVTGTASLYTAFQNMNAPDVDYDILQLQADYKEIQADNQLVKAEQEANVLRQQYDKAVGDYRYNTARRNVKVGEGSAAQNEEQSAKAVGQDIVTMKQNAEFQAEMLRMEANRMREGSKDVKKINQYKRAADLFTGIGTFADAFGVFSKDMAKTFGPKTEEVKPTTTEVKPTETTSIVKPVEFKKTEIIKPVVTPENPVTSNSGGEDLSKFRVNLYDTPGADVMLTKYGALDKSKANDLPPKVKADIIDEYIADGNEKMAMRIFGTKTVKDRLAGKKLELNSVASNINDYGSNKERL